jgi:carbon starvation protein
MTLPLLAIVFLGILTAGYFVYGRWVAGVLELDDRSVTPAHTHNDGTDFVPTNAFYLFGQHFSAIAAAGPIAGPIVACTLFGWGPCLLWILVGVVMIGAVHDFTSLAASVRHGASSIAEVARQQIDGPAGRALMIFIWLALVYIIVAFADITAGSFVTKPEELGSMVVDFNPGGAVAAASILFLSLSLLLGVVQKYLKPPLWVASLIFVPLAFVSAMIGTEISEFFIMDVKSWALLIVVYCALGSMAPVWLLLQPRGFLGGFILYFSLIVGVIGIFFGGYEIKQPIFTSFDLGTSTGLLFPFLFVTIACGACSGFHGLVCSGTTSKQIDRESHMHPIGYGAMLAEAFVAFIALSTIMILSLDEAAGLRPGTIYGQGLGRYMTLVIGEQYLPFAITMGAMAFSTFVFDTLDVSTRLGRYLIQELTGLTGTLGAWLGTGLTIGVPALILAMTSDGSWIKFWTLFGASNQLLAALTLLSVTLWLHEARKRIAFTLIPMLFVLSTTLTALILIAKSGFESSRGFDTNLLNSLVSVALILLAIFICFAALKKTWAARAGRNLSKS